MAQRHVSRRTFIQGAAVAAGAVAAPYFVPHRAFGANDRVVTGHIGVGGQGLSNLNGFLDHAAAVCDVDSTHLATAKKKVEEKGRKCDAYDDLRKLLERKDIDAVVISTPDHWHCLATILACQAGKDVYCEKPLSLSIGEGRKMVEAARKYKRIVQTGSQQRSADNFRQACELVRNGYLGKIQKVMVGIPGVNFKGTPVADSDPPAELNYDLWLGPAPQKPYNKGHVHYNFRFFWDYSGGQMTNWGAHHIDIAQWGLGMDDSGPVSSEGTAKFDEKKTYEVSNSCRITHTYANGVQLIVGQGEADCPGGTTFIGEKGTLHVNRGELKSTPGDILKTKLADSDVHLYDSANHHKNFLDCVASRKLPICDVEIGHRSSSVCHLGNLSIRLGRKLNWDPAKEQFVGDDEANKWVTRPYRSPWKLEV